MANLFDDASLSLSCPACKHTTQQKITYLERNPKVTCPSCKQVIQVNADELRKARQEINKAVEDMKRRFK